MNNIYGFHGCDGKSGVTMISQSVAQQIATMVPNKDVLFISLCGRKNNQYVRENHPTIDYYKEKIDSGVLMSKSTIMENRMAPNLCMIDGLENEMEQRLFFPEAVSAMLADIKPEFDFIIADTGCELDCGLAIGGLKMSAKKYMVIPQSEAAIERFCKGRMLYERTGISFDAFIINKFMEKDIMSLKYVKKRAEITNSEVYVVRETGLSRQAEYEKKTFIDMKDAAYMAEITEIANSILVHAGVKESDKVKKRKWRDFI